MGLGRLPQDDFSAGMWRSLAAHRIPRNGCFELRNYLIDNEGLPYERGGIEAASTDFSSGDFTLVYDGLFPAGRRTFFATKTEWGVLDADGVTPITLDAGPVAGNGLLTPRRVTSIAGRIYIDGGRMYDGARKSGYTSSFDGYGTGATGTQGSDVIVGLGGTQWLTYAAPGMSIGLGGRGYVIKEVIDDTHVRVTTPFHEPTITANYAIGPVGIPMKQADIYGTAGKRLLTLTGDKLEFSRNIDNPTEVRTQAGTGGGGGAEFAGILAKPLEDPENFLDGDYHIIPGSPDGLGLESWGDTAIVFTTDGVWLVSNMDLSPVDNAGNVQQALTHSAPQVVLWHRNGLAAFQDAFIVPARDGVYIMGAGSLERIDTPITPLYRDYFRQGLTLGVATVFEGHYLLPILDGTTAVDLLVCRLDRPVRTPAGIVRPWSHFEQPPVRTFAQQETGGSPNLLIASDGTKLLRARYFEPQAVASDDNGSVYTSELVTRDLPTGNGNKNLVREITVDYDLTDTAAGDNPTLIADFATAHPAETAPYTSAGDNAPEGTDQFKKWLLPVPPKSRYIRVRLRSSGRLQTLLIRAISIFVRASNKND